MKTNRGISRITNYKYDKMATCSFKCSNVNFSLKSSSLYLCLESLAFDSLSLILLSALDQIDVI